MRIYILGAGKVGRALAAALRKVGAEVTLRAARGGLPRKAIVADVIVLAIRDRTLATTAADLARLGLVDRRAVCVHAAGSLDAEILAPLRPVCRGVAQMHPMISFASLRAFPSLAGGNLHVQGDPEAVRRGTKLGKLLGMTPRTIPGLDAVGYHAAAGLVANGAAALAALGERLLVASNVPQKTARRMLGPLLRSVAENVEALGFPDALTGPVRRGDPGAIARHFDLIAARVPEAIPLYVAAVAAQVPLARALAEGPKEGFDAIERFAADALRKS
jgi:predicted short-subunit dehydrogenase-like oxidoreductase (DUF2520 family)